MRTFGNSADRLLTKPTELRGMKLRYALLAVLLQARGTPLTITDLLETFARAGLTVPAPRPRKAVADALTCERRKQRVRSVGRGAYAAVRLPDGTRRRILTWFRLATEAARSGARPAPAPARRLSPMHADRVERTRARMSELGVDVLLVSVGADLPYLTGYEAMPLERLTMLVLPREGDVTLVVPRLEAPRVEERPEVFAVRPWDETDDPVELVARLAGSPATVAIGDRTWARFVIDLQASLPGATFRKAGEVMAPLRSVKDADEVAALRRAAQAADRVAAELQAGAIPLVGRTEAEISADLGRRLRAEGHQRVNFAIVAAGENAASPHHEPGPRTVRAGEVVLCDFGGTMPDGYCSDITRCVWTGGSEPPSEFRDLYAVLQDAQAQAVESATVGTPCEDVDGVARRLITDGGYGPQFIHRTGHGIGLEEHEDPYLVGGNCEALAPGHAFSIEPGIYVEGRWGARIEDIVVATESGPEALNQVPHDLVAVDA